MTQQINFKPSAALVSYSAGNGSFYLESHKITNGKFGPGQPMSKKGLLELKESLDTIAIRNDEKLKGIIPKNLLYLNTDKMNPCIIWSTPAQKRKLFFSKELEIPNGEAIVPAMIWMRKNDTLSVFGIVKMDNEILKTKLYHAPFHNMYENGKVCLGTVNTSNQKKTFVEFMQQVESWFFNSRFSAIIEEHICCKQNINEYWKNSIILDKCDRFSLYAVKHTKYNTLKDLINE